MERDNEGFEIDLDRKVVETTFELSKLRKLEEKERIFKRRII